MNHIWIDYQRFIQEMNWMNELNKELNEWIEWMNWMNELKELNKLNKLSELFWLNLLNEFSVSKVLNQLTGGNLWCIKVWMQIVTVFIYFIFKK